jgi:hypothetical protein
MSFRVRTAVTSVALLAPMLLPSAAAAHETSVKQPALDAPTAEADQGTGSENMEFVANLEFPVEVEGGSFRATDLDFHTYRTNAQGKVLPPGSRGGQERDFAFVGTALNGLHVVDITDREDPRLVARYDCRISQADVFVFEQGDRVLAAYSLDAVSQNQPEGSDCHEDNGVSDAGERGTFLVDVTDPYAPESVSFLPMRKGTHQVTVHPSGEYVYNSAAVLVTTEPGTIEVYDVGAEATPEEPVLVDEIQLVTGLDSHDLTFNEDGSRLYSAALTHSFVIDSSDPTDNQIVSRIFDPAINIHHDAHAVTVDTVYGEREFMLIGDELAGASGTGVCPGGGVHVYDITDELEQVPVKVGAFFIPEVRVTGDLDTCTAHVLDIQEDEQLISIAWYNAGVRVLDYSGLGELGPQGLSIGVSPFLGGSLTPGITEVGHFRFPDSNLWSAKVPEVEDDGSFYIYGGDITRTLDVFRYDATAPRQEDGGSWLSPLEALAQAPVEGTALLDDGGTDGWKPLLGAH